ncbi:MAG TPA: PAS domain S-box protein, partial [Candidatus Nanopelagicales bacterium]|nr:PAS domain S-box protein [Candidatus Nanopelagicales bacterium]
MTRDGDGRFDVAMRHATIGMAIIAPDGTFLEVNPALCAMLGRTEEEMLAASWQELTHPDDLEVDVALVQELLDGRRESYRLAKRYLRPDGAVVFGDLSVGCVRDDSGAVEFFVSQIVDQTEREMAGETLARTEARYGAALSAKRDPHVFLDAVRGDDGTIVDFVYADANAAALGWLGRTLEELQERSLLTAFPSHRATGMFDAYVRTVETGEQLVEDERRVRSEVLGTDAWFDFRAIKVLDGLSLSWRDVTSKVETRNQIAEADERHRLLAENASDVVFRVFADGTVDWVVGSVAELLGRSDDDIRGRSALDLFVAEDLGDLEGTGVRLRHGETIVDTVRVVRPDGTHRWVSRRLRAVMADDGEHASWYVLAISDAQAHVENQHA